MGKLGRLEKVKYFQKSKINKNKGLNKLLYRIIEIVKSIAQIGHTEPMRRKFLFKASAN